MMEEDEYLENEGHHIRDEMKYLDQEPLDDSFQKWVQRKLDKGYTAEQIISIIGLWLSRLPVMMVAERAKERVK